MVQNILFFPQNYFVNDSYIAKFNLLAEAAKFWLNNRGIELNYKSPVIYGCLHIFCFKSFRFGFSEIWAPAFFWPPINMQQVAGGLKIAPRCEWACEFVCNVLVSFLRCVPGSLPGDAAPLTRIKFNEFTLTLSVIKWLLKMYEWLFFSVFKKRNYYYIQMY